MYSVHGIRVIRDAYSGWECTCADFERGLECVHLEQARLFSEMRRTAGDDDTIELHLSTAELQALTQGVPLEDTDFRGAEAFIAAPRRAKRYPRLASVLGAAAVACASVSIGMTYLSTMQERPGPAVAPPSLATTVAPPVARVEPPPAAPVTFANPFDAGEIFEFPAGTSESDARDAVARFLLDRARNRLAAATEARGAVRTSQINSRVSVER